MATKPPSFYGGEVPQVGIMPQPIDASAPLREGLDAAARTLGQAVDEKRSTDLQVMRINHERQLQLAAGDTAAYIATEQGNLQTDVLGYREHSLPGADGHEAMVNERIAKFREDVAAHIGNNPELAARFGDNVAEIAANARTGEVKWAMEQRAKKSVDDSDTLQNGLQSNIRTAVTAGTYTDQMMADADKLDQRAVSALPIGGNAQAQLIKVRHQERLVTLIDAKTDVDPAAVMKEIDAGKYGELDDKVLQPLREHARVRADQLANQAEQTVNATMAQNRAVAGNMIEDVHGGTLVDDRQLQTYRAQAALSQKPEDIRLVHDLDRAIAENKVNATYGNSTIDERLAAQHAIEGTKGWQANDQLRTAHDQLTTLISRDSHAAEQDPVTLYERQTGQTAPPLNLNDPKAMRERFIVGDQAAQRFRKAVPMHFTEAEAGDLRTQYNQATVGGKADFMLTLGAYGSQRAREMMFQIAPTKPELTRLAEMAANRDPGVQAIVREAADGSAVPVKDGVAGAVRNLAQANFGPAFARMPGDRQRAILQVATWVYAHRAAEGGKAAVFDPSLATQAIGAALGGTGSKGGVGNRNGAAVLLPMGGTQQDFDAILTTSTPEQVRAAANGVPKWADRDLTLSEFRDLVPVQINDTGSQALYAFRSRGGSGYVKNERGEDYVVDIRRLADARKFDHQLAAHGYQRR